MHSSATGAAAGCPACRHCQLPEPDRWPELCRWKEPSTSSGADRPCDLDRWDEADWLADQRDAAKAKQFADRLAAAKFWGGLAIVVALILLGLFAGNARAETGIASVYGGKPYEGGSQTASGQPFRAGALTAAHRTLPFGTRAAVTNARNGRRVVVRINDRGPYIRGRVIDLTPAGARAIGSTGLAPVSLEVIP